MIFLSASIPNPRKPNQEKYFSTADIIAIRDAIRALSTVVIPKSYLVWGGHPAITPLIASVMSSMQFNVQSHVTLYQSEFFRDIFPLDNQYFERVIYTERRKDREESLKEMRLRMFNENDFKAAVFIGGMDGVEDEYKMFVNAHPTAKIIPVASTGAAAKIIYDNMVNKLDERLVYDYAYMALFRSLFEGIIN